MSDTLIFILILAVFIILVFLINPHVDMIAGEKNKLKLLLWYNRWGNINDRRYVVLWEESDGK